MQGLKVARVINVYEVTIYELQSLSILHAARSLVYLLLVSIAEQVLTFCMSLQKEKTKYEARESADTSSSVWLNYLKDVICELK